MSAIKVRALWVVAPRLGDGVAERLGERYGYPVHRWAPLRDGTILLPPGPCFTAA